VGGSNNTKDDASDAMTSLQFVGFAKVLGFLDGNPLTASDLDRLFLRSIRAPPAKETEERAGALMDLAGPVGLVSKEWSKARSAIKTTLRMKMSGKATSTMSQYNFMGALVRLANVKYRNLPSLGSRLDAMCTERLAPHVYDELNLLGDRISKLMLLPPMTAVWEKSRVSVEKVFRFYAARDMSLESRFQTTTMNMRELNEMCEDAKGGGLHLPVRDTLLAFARVNIEDEIYQQDDSENSSTELVLDEFFELITRVYFAEWSKTGNSDVGPDGLSFALSLKEWLNGHFSPTALAMIKTAAAKPSQL